MTATIAVIPDLIDPVTLFANEHEGGCCECCDGYCPRDEVDTGPDWPQLLLVTDSRGVEYVGTVYVIVRRDLLDPEHLTPGLLEEAHQVTTAPPWMRIPATRPPAADLPMTARLLDRIDRAGLTRHAGDAITHLYDGDQHAGYTRHAKSPAGPTAITAADLPLLRRIADVTGIGISDAALAIHHIRNAS